MTSTKTKENKKILLISGLGPEFREDNYLKGTLFDPQALRKLKRYYDQNGAENLKLSDFQFIKGKKSYPLLRPLDEKMPHLTSSTLQDILTSNDIDFRFFPTEKIWKGKSYTNNDNFGIVCLSTTFMWSIRIFEDAILWIRKHFPSAIVIVGGMFSNLKYKHILRNYPEVKYVIIGDGEIALPELIKRLEDKQALDNIPNLAIKKNNGKIVMTKLQYIDLDEIPAPRFVQDFETLPYTSMRGCPFRCKFCTYFAGYSKWRYISASRIYNDWLRYKEENNTQHIKAMDSSFTIPQSRLKKVLQLLPKVGITWEAYARTDSITDIEIVKALERADCTELSIGFESMSNLILKYMNKRATSEQNLKAMTLLKNSNINLRASFIVGYPGETPEEFEKTSNYLLNEHYGDFMLYAFEFKDESLPVWKDRDNFNLEILYNRDNDPIGWKHIGMDLKTAQELRKETLDKIRWESETAVYYSWQNYYSRPFVPQLSKAKNLRIEKLIERAAFLAKDYPNRSEGLPLLKKIVDELDKYNVKLLHKTNNSS